MVAIVTVLFAFPLGFFLRNRLAAYVAYIAIFAYSFTFQTLYLLRAWVGDDHTAFSADPDKLPLNYLAVTGAIYIVGFLLITWPPPRHETPQPHQRCQPRVSPLIRPAPTTDGPGPRRTSWCAAGPGGRRRRPSRQLLDGLAGAVLGAGHPADGLLHQGAAEVVDAAVEHRDGSRRRRA